MVDIQQIEMLNVEDIIFDIYKNIHEHKDIRPTLKKLTILLIKLNKKNIKTECYYITNSGLQKNLLTILSDHCYTNIIINDCNKYKYLYAILYNKYEKEIADNIKIIMEYMYFTDYNYNKAILATISSGRSNILKILLTHYTFKTITQHIFGEWLLLSARYGCIFILLELFELLKNQSDRVIYECINYPDSKNNNALIISAKHCHFLYFKELYLNCFGDIDIVNNCNKSAFDYVKSKSSYKWLFEYLKKNSEKYILLKDTYEIWRVQDWFDLDKRYIIYKKINYILSTPFKGGFHKTNKEATIEADRYINHIKLNYVNSSVAFYIDELYIIKNNENIKKYNNGCYYDFKFLLNDIKFDKKAKNKKYVKYTLYFIHMFIFVFYCIITYKTVLIK
jgi:hypothetical protein